MSLLDLDECSRIRIARTCDYLRISEKEFENLLISVVKLRYGKEFARHGFKGIHPGHVSHIIRDVAGYFAVSSVLTRLDLTPTRGEAVCGYGSSV